MTAPGGFGSSLGSAVVQVVADVRRFARSVRQAVQRAFGGTGSGSIYYGANYAGRQAGDAFVTRFARAVTGGLQRVGKIFAKIFSPAALLGGAKILALVAALKQLILLGPALAGVGQAIAAIGAALPALVIGGVLVAKTLSSAFKGVGEAMKAAAEGDAEALAAAMKNLTPAAQSFVKEVEKAQPALKDLQKTIQETFFTQLKGGFTDLTDPSVIGALKTAMTGIAESLGQAARAVASVVKGAGQSGQLSRIFAPLERGIERLTKLAPALTTMFLRLAEVAAPFLESFAGVAADKIGGLIAKVNQAASDGTLKGFFENAIDAAAAFGGVLADIGRIFGSVMDALNVEGSSAVGMLGSLIDALADFFETAEGAGVLQTLGSLISTVGDILKNVVVPLLKPAAQFIGTLAMGLGTFLSNVAPGLTAVSMALGELLTGLINELGPEFFELVNAISGPLSRALFILAEHIDEMTPTAIEMARVIGPTLGFAFQQLGDFLRTLLPSLEFLARIIQENQVVFMALAGVIGVVFLAIGGGLWLLSQLIDGARAMAELLYDNVWSNFPVMLGLITGAAGALLTALVGPIDSLGELWDTVVSGGERAMDFIRSIPGAIASLGGAFYNAAASLGASIGRGFAQIGNFASDVGNKIYGTIRNGINGIVRGINAGIARIDDVIPGSLGRLPMFARGGIIDKPTVGVMGEGGRREVVLPLTDPARSAQLAQQSGLMDVLRGAGLGGGTPIINITAILDGFGVLRIVDQRVETAMTGQGQELAFGPRGI